MEMQGMRKMYLWMSESNSGEKLPFCLKYFHQVKETVIEMAVCHLGAILGSQCM